ncbi:unnamed protein product [Rhodiola kirilowii]
MCRLPCNTGLAKAELDSCCRCNSASGDHSEATGETTSNAVEESEDSCELKYGSYCLWRRRHQEEMKDSMVKKLKDLLFVARAYYPSVAKLPRQETLSHEMKQNVPHQSLQCGYTPRISWTP